MIPHPKMRHGGGKEGRCSCQSSQKRQSRMLCLKLHSHLISAYLGYSRHKSLKCKHKTQPGLGLLCFGRKHLSPFQLSLVPKYFALQSPWGTRINIPTKCSQSYSTEFKCAVSSTSAAEKCYSRNTFRNRCKEPL